VVNRF